MAANPYLSSIDEVLEELPRPQRIDRAPCHKDVSCVIAIAGFERRCLSAAESLHSLGWQAKSSVCVRYANREMDASNSKHFGDLCGELTAIGGRIAPNVIDHNDHAVDADFGQQILESLRKLDLDVNSERTHIVFDITVGSSRLLLEGLHALLKTNVKLTLTYTEVAAYRPTFDEYRSHLQEQRVRQIEPPEFLTHGVDRVEILKSIPGQTADSRPAYLVVFPAFSFTRIGAVIEEMAPSRVQWIFGVPHLVGNRWRIDAQREYHESLIETSHRHCFVSTFDYRETLEVLERIYQKRRESYGMFVASLGSKMQKVGQVLFHVLRPEATAVVSIPQEWNPERYSDDLPRAVYSLDLGIASRVRDVLWRTRQLRV